MKDWTESDVPPSGILDLWTRVSRYVRSARDVAFKDAVALTGAADGELIAHGQRGAPRRVVANLTAATSGTPTVKIGAINATHVRLHASAAAVVDLTFFL